MLRILVCLQITFLSVLEKIDGILEELADLPRFKQQTNEKLTQHDEKLTQQDSRLALMDKRLDRLEEKSKFFENGSSSGRWTNGAPKLVGGKK